jgi:hypothetical protein
LKKLDHNTGFWEKRYFFRQNWQKLHKIVIITSTPGGDYTTRPRSQGVQAFFLPGDAEGQAGLEDTDGDRDREADWHAAREHEQNVLESILQKTFRPNFTN